METIDGGNRVSKRLTTTDDDGNNHLSSSSVHQVMFNDDLLIEILLRLPVISLFFFKSVSKRWLSIITSPAFFNLHFTYFPNIDPPCGFFLQQTNNTHNHFEHDFVSLHSRIPGGKKKKPSAFTFGCFGSDASNVEVLQSCKGLVLCVIRTDPWFADKIYVYNPSLNVFKMLPPVLGSKSETYFDPMRLAFDPAKSPHYKVLHVRIIHPDVNQQPRFFQTQIYSSETGCWRIGDKFHLRWMFGDFNRGVYWNDAIHWLDYEKNITQFNLDAERPYITAEPPKTFDWDSYTELFESHGSLLLACAVNPHPKDLEIYEMRNWYSGWSLKYIVKYEGSSIEAFFKTWKKSTIRFRKDMVIMVEEREEESFIVLKLGGKFVKYNLLSKTLHMLCDIDTHSTESRTFPFIASFAAV